MTRPIERSLHSATVGERGTHCDMLASITRPSQLSLRTSGGVGVGWEGAAIRCYYHQGMRTTVTLALGVVLCCVVCVTPALDVVLCVFIFLKSFKILLRRVIECCPSPPPPPPPPPPQSNFAPSVNSCIVLAYREIEPAENYRGL